MTTETKPKPIHPEVRIGHVHLKVADLERAIAFYRDVLGFELTQRYGRQAAFLSAGGYHHHIGLNTWESSGGSPPSAGATGLYHLAILYPTRAELAGALRRLIQARIPRVGHASYIHTTPHGWTLDMGANSILVGKAIERCCRIINSSFDEAAKGKIFRHREVVKELKSAIRASVANFEGAEYEGEYSG